MANCVQGSKAPANELRWDGHIRPRLGQGDSGTQRSPTLLTAATRWGTVHQPRGAPESPGFSAVALLWRPLRRQLCSAQLRILTLARRLPCSTLLTGGAAVI